MPVRAAVAALLALHLAWSVAPALRAVATDFPNYYVPARAVVDGRPLDRAYERAWFAAEALRAGVDVPGSFVPHPPANALLLVPLARAPVTAAKAAWTLVLVAAWAGTFLALRGAVALPAWTLALLMLVPSASLANALAYGQPYPLLALCLALSLRAARRSREGAAGLWLAPLALLKLYGVPFAAGLAAARRGRAVLGLVAGALAIGALSLAVLGGPVHRAYAREVLPASLEGRIQDPYATAWQSPASLAHRLFQREPDLNPDPAADRPALARAAGVGLSAALLVLAALAAPGREAGAQWAILALAALAASPLPLTYHFLLLVVPAAVLLERAGPGTARSALVWVLVAFTTSPLPHYAAGLAHGWWNLAAVPRLWAVLALFALAVAPALTARRAAVAVAAGALAAGAVTLVPRPRDPGWTRVAESGGYLAAEPRACAGALTWVAVRGGRFVRVGAGGPVSCAAEEADAAAVAGGRHGRLSPDGRRIVFERWRGSWDLAVLDRATGRVDALTSDAANEVEPAWLGPARVVFASDRDRGLGSTALYSVPVPPATPAAEPGPR